jgi:hypothetical protein
MTMVFFLGLGFSAAFLAGVLSFGFAFTFTFFFFGVSSSSSSSSSSSPLLSA